MPKKILLLFAVVLLLLGCGNSGDLNVKNQNNQGTSTSPFAISNLTPTMMTLPSGTIYSQPYAFEANGLRDSFYVDVIMYRAGVGPIMSLRHFGSMVLAGRWDTSIEGTMKLNTSNLASGASGTLSMQMFLSTPTETSNILTSNWQVQ